MLHVFGFHRVGVAVGDLYFADPGLGPEEEGREHGVRLEVRLLDSPPRPGSIYASRPIVVDRPIWRADLLETVSGAPGSHDRTHHHPQMRGWEPGTRQFDPAMSTDPIGFVGDRLGDLHGLLKDADMDPSDVDDRDAAELRDAVPQIVACVEQLLQGVRQGRLGLPPEGEPVESARIGWL